MASDITLLPLQTARIHEESTKTGAAIGVSQFGSSLILDNGREKFVINSQGLDIVPATQESFLVE